MSYTSSDPEKFNRDPDTSSLASASTTASLPQKYKKKPWSKFKSSIKSIGEKMSSKHSFADATESSEQRRMKKNKKSKASSSGDGKSSSSDSKPVEKSVVKGPASLVKKLSVDTISTPFVGYQPTSVSPTKSYAKVVHKSGSTSESNLSVSDNDTPRKSLTSDKSTKYNLSVQNSPDSGHLSQNMESTGSLGDSRPPSEATEEEYASGLQKEAISDVSVDSDYTSLPPVDVKATTDESVVDNLIVRTQRFAESLVSPDSVKEENVDLTEEFIKAEAVVKPSTAVDALKTGSKLERDNLDISKNNDPVSTNVETENSKLSFVTPEIKQEPESKLKLTASGVDEIEGRKKKKINDTKSNNTSADLIKSEQVKFEKDMPIDNSNDNSSLPEKSKSTRGDTAPHSEQIGEKPVLESKLEKSDNTVSEFTLENATPESKPENIEPERVLEIKPDKSDEHITDISEMKTNDETENATHPTNKPSVSLPKQEETKETPTLPKHSKRTEKVSIPKVFPNPQDLTSPLVDSGPSSAQTPQMVEDKLEAFLSTEGWAGTIKDITVKTSPGGSQQPDKRECLYKILVIGELGTGKTSIIKRYVHQFFSQHYRATIGVDFALKVLNWDPNTIIRLQLWDIAGQERFGNMTRVYYKEAVGAFIVFDVTRSATFDAVLKWKQDLDSKVQLADGSPIPCVLLANKCDQQKEGIVNTPSKMEEYCKENNFSTWFETSAKENINIDEAAKSLVTQILQNDKMSQNGKDSAIDGSKFPLDGKSEEESRTCAC